MAVQQQTQRHQAYRVETGRRSDWLGDSIVSGFIATIAMSVAIAGAFALSRTIGVRDGSQVERWFWALTHNPVIDATQNAIILAIGTNLLMGLVWAIVYGYDAEGRLSGSGWRKGMFFAIGPFLLSVIAFFPIMDGGILGRNIHAGPLPIVGNLILHLIYGAVLGGVYAIDLEAWLDGSVADRAHAEAQQRGAAVGTVAGIVAGLAIGWLLGPTLDDVGGRGLIALIGSMTGGALGLAAGSLAGAEWADRGHDPRMPVAR